MSAAPPVRGRRGSGAVTRVRPGPPEARRRTPGGAAEGARGDADARIGLDLGRSGQVADSPGSAGASLVAGAVSTDLVRRKAGAGRPRRPESCPGLASSRGERMRAGTGGRASAGPRVAPPSGVGRRGAGPSPSRARYRDGKAAGTAAGRESPGGFARRPAVSGRTPPGRAARARPAVTSVPRPPRGPPSPSRRCRRVPTRTRRPGCSAGTRRPRPQPLSRGWRPCASPPPCRSRC